MDRLTLQLVKRDGQLVPLTNQDSVRLNAFTQLLAEGQRVDVHLSQCSDHDHSLSQLAKFHALVRDISLESGQSQADIKDLIKHETGLTKVDETGQLVVRSLRDCSKVELSHAIQQAIDYADMLGIRLPDSIPTQVV